MLNTVVNSYCQYDITDYIHDYLNMNIKPYAIHRSEMNRNTYAIHRSDRTPGWGICIGCCFLCIHRRFYMGTLGK